MKDLGTLATGSVGAAGTGTGLSCPCLGVRFCDVGWVTRPPRASVSPPVKWACSSAHPAGCEERRGGTRRAASRGHAHSCHWEVGGDLQGGGRQTFLAGLWSVGPELGRKSCFSVASRLLTWFSTWFCSNFLLPLGHICVDSLRRAPAGGGPGRSGADTEPEHSLQQGKTQPWVVVPSLEITPHPCGGAMKCWGDTSRYFAPGQVPLPQAGLALLPKSQGRVCKEPQSLKAERGILEASVSTVQSPSEQLAGACRRGKDV